MIFLTENVGRITSHPLLSCVLWKLASCSDQVRLPLLFYAGSYPGANSGEVMEGHLPQAQCFLQIHEVFLILRSSWHIWQLKPQSAPWPLTMMKVIFWLTYLLFCFISQII